ncbi:hypothetical protein Scep_017773 [Stephania cephalantha]|uniref:Uncharacterized protein n=1 Tax=Stephania cephalantha TaxID=152367 RepID=A0AAP0NVZ2_9MAGN
MEFPVIKFQLCTKSWKQVVSKEENSLMHNLINEVDRILKPRFSFSTRPRKRTGA